MVRAATGRQAGLADKAKSISPEDRIRRDRNTTVVF
jgi:hypothetical protein